jgi:MFS family permease
MNRKSSHDSNHSETFKLINEPLKEKYLSILSDVGLEGKFQKIMFVLICSLSFISVLIIPIFPMNKDLPDHICINYEELNINQTYSKFRGPQFLIIETKSCIAKFCQDYSTINEQGINTNQNKTQILIVDKSSVRNLITELDILCDHHIFFEILNAALFLGRIVGNILFSYIADSYGRLQSATIQTYMIIFCYTISFFIKSKWISVLVVFTLAATLNMYHLINALSTEYMSQNYYTTLNGFIGVFFSICGLYTVTIFYYYRNWNILILIHLSVSFLSLYLIKSYMVETPFFLLQQKNYKDLNRVLRKISQVNGTYESFGIDKKISGIEKEIYRNELKQEKDFFEEKKTSYNEMLLQNTPGPYLISFKSSKTTKNFLKLVLIYLSMNLTYFGQILNIEKVSGNFFFNNLIVYIGEIIAELSSVFLMNKYKRVELIFGCFAISTILSFFINILEAYSMFPVVMTITILLNSYFISVVFVVVYTYAVEIFDPDVKNTMNCLLDNLSNIFMIFSPPLLEFFTTPYATYGIVSGIAAWNSLYLHETKLN